MMNFNTFEDSLCSQKQCDINNRLMSRNVPDSPLQSYLSTRPVLTKYSIMPVIDPRRPSKTQFPQQPVYDITSNFNPGTDNGPWSGYAYNINSESELRNQFNALQKCDQASYVPSSQSSLYLDKWSNSTMINNQPFPHLFEQPSFSSFNPNPQPDKIGHGIFFNATRQQLKDLTQETKCK